MNIYLIIALCIIWYIIGATSFIYWWTREFDFTTTELLFALMAGILGPLAFFLGYSIHYQNTSLINPRVLFKRRANEKLP
jgi:prepilin signal peptidase PulO-like enzyme (type II secretory pathway)